MSPLALYRLSRFLYLKKIPLLPRILKAIVFLLFKAVIPYQCQIGESTKLWHSGLGIIIHPGTVIGNNCNIYNFVVFGGAHDGPGGLPTRITIGDNCNISTGVKILAHGDLTIGDNATIAANSVVLADVPANVVAGGIPAKVLKKKDTL